MNMSETAFWQAINLVIRDSTASPAHAWSLVIRANDADVHALNIENVTVARRPLKSYGEQIDVSFSIGEGDYMYLLYPYKDNLTATLTKTILQRGLTTKTNDEKAKASQVYHCQLCDIHDEALAANSPASSNREIANRISTRTVRIQLIDKVLYALRMQTVGFIARKHMGIDVIRAILGEYSKTASDPGQSAVYGVDVAPNWNTTVRDHIVIPHNTKLLAAFPRIVNENSGGIYRTGFAYFLQKQMWYVFPPYDIKRYEANNSSTALTILNVPANRLPNIETTWTRTDNQVTILATGDVYHVDRTEQKQLEQGNGVRFIDASKFVDEFVTVQDNKAYASRANITTNATGAPRPDNLNHTVEADTKITANPFIEYSKLAERLGSTVYFVWEHSDPDLLYPGMPCKFIYLLNNVPTILHGVLIDSVSTEQLTNKDTINSRFVTSTVVTLFLEGSVQSTTTKTSKPPVITQGSKANSVPLSDNTTLDQVANAVKNVLHVPDSLVAKVEGYFNKPTPPLPPILPPPPTGV